MIALIGIVLVIYWISMASFDAGVIALVVAVAGLIWLSCSVMRRDRKAWNNRQDYWAKGGPERERREPVVRNNKPEERWTAGRNPVGRLPDAGMQTEMGRMFQTNNDARKLELFVCPRCGRDVRAVSKRVMCDGKMMREYECPRCRMAVRTGI